MTTRELFLAVYESINLKAVQYFLSQLIKCLRLLKVFRNGSLWS